MLTIALVVFLTSPDLQLQAWRFEQQCRLDAGLPAESDGVIGGDAVWYKDGTAQTNIVVDWQGTEYTVPGRGM